MGATWPEILANAGMVRAYHLDLFATLWKGKSPTAEKARKQANREREAEELARELASLAPEVRAGTEAALLLQADLRKVANIQRAGFAVTTDVDPGLAKLDLFAEFRRRKALALAEGTAARRNPDG